MLALLPVFNSWAFLETRRLVQVFPEHVWKIWNIWELRVLVLVSLTLQGCLLFFGSRRRYSVKTWLRVFLWVSYLGADSVATIALGVISDNLGKSCDCNESRSQNALMAFWAPFLLLHLGGPDTITAYAIQDNELWLRHCLGLVVQSGVALYILVLSWEVSWLSFLTIPMFLTGLIKYAERVWALKYACYESITAHMAYYQQLFGEKLERVFCNGCAEDLACVTSHYDINPKGEAVRLNDYPKMLRYAFILFENFRCLFRNQKVSESIFLRDSDIYFRDSETAWKTVEVELGYAYDVYYTKAPMFFTGWGFLFRFFSFTSALFALVLLHKKERQKHPPIDLIITYILLVGSIFMEISAFFFFLFFSDWPLQRYDNVLLRYYIKLLFNSMRNAYAQLKVKQRQRWSNSVGQLNLLDLCLKDESLQHGHGTPKPFASLREWDFNKMFPRLNRELKMLFCRTNKQVSAELKDVMFNTLCEKQFSGSNGFSEQYDKYITNETASVETYQRIIIWHIATDLCFYTDSGANERDKNQRRMSKDVSDYMMYILETCPLELPEDDAKFIFDYACKLVVQGFYIIDVENLSSLSKAQVCEKLISEFEDAVPGERGSLLTENLLPLAVEVANKLNQKDGKWEILSKFWVENLAYVATLCQGHNHAQLLRKGGEFLTHVWILQENLKRIGSSRGGSTTGLESEFDYGQGSGNGFVGV